MRFVKTEDLKTGMRLARPIYNKNGVLLYERNSKLTMQGISSVKNFGLLGIFILEPAEPVPPMTRGDIEFERFQTMCVFSIREELDTIAKTGRAQKTQAIASDIIRNYGHLDAKINFLQNLRSKEDYTYKHSLNVAIICAMIANILNMMVDEQMETVQAALVHDIGKIMRFEEEIAAGGSLIDMPMEAKEVAGHALLETAFSARPNIKRICSQTQKMLASMKTGEDISDIRQVWGARVLAVAETYDRMTAMKMDEEPASEVEALKFLMSHPEIYHTKVVDALIRSVNILVPGVSIELNTGEKALVLTANEKDILRPVILMFRDNSVIDLADTDRYDDLEIRDIMRTLDNRHVMNIDLLKQSGIEVEEEEYVEVPST
ncbi:MAG: HD domain-containing protein [Lachnospiraceae bacterium]|nr:HD domain-containing protein [Lachnospiraceae bacterium]